MGRIYEPRAVLRLFVPIPRGDDYESVGYDLLCSKARLERNDHTRADTLSVEVDWIDAGVDPRWIAGATCQFYLWDARRPPPATADGTDVAQLREEFGLEPVDARGEGPPDGALRFVGRMVKPARTMKGDSLKVSLEFHDYTSFFLLAKPYASDGVPLYSENLGEAWARICAHVPGADQLADNIELRGLDAFPVIGSAVAERFRARGSLHIKPNQDAWAVWQQCVGMMGLISSFQLDRCIVTTATDYYTLDDPPGLLYGRDLLDLSEERNNDFALKGVGITSFDPVTGRTLEALYNPLAGNVKKVKAKGRKKPQETDDSKEYDVFAVPGITEQAALDALARRVYEERSRQEMRGSVTTAEMALETAGGKLVDALSLWPGDTLGVSFLGAADASFLRDFSTLFSSQEERARYLVTRGYEPAVAEIIAANVERQGDKGNLFYVRGVTADLDSNEDGGPFRLTFETCNRIDPLGGASAGGVEV